MTQHTVEGHYLDPALEKSLAFCESVQLDFRSGGNEVTVRFPRLSPTHLQRVGQQLRHAQQRLGQLPVREILDCIGQAVGLWAESNYGPRLQALDLLPTVTGYSAESVQASLSWLTRRLCRQELENLLILELGNPGYLDAFVRRSGAQCHSRAFGPCLTGHFLSGNVPGLPALSIACALLTKSANLCKVASQEPVFTGLFCRSLAEANPVVGAALAALYWPGGDKDLEAPVLQASDAVIAYGGQEATSDLRARAPATSRFLSYGHKLSFAVVGACQLDAVGSQALAERAARDACAFDQQACLSAHAVYVERGATISPLQFAEHLALAMAAFEKETPRGAIAAHEATAIHKLRELYEFREYDDQAVRSFCSPEGTEWTVLYEEEPQFSPSCLNRVVRVKPVDSVLQVPRLVESIRPHLQTVGVAVAESRLEALATELGALGVSRVCPLGSMTDHGLAWHHDGRYNVLDLIRWIDLERATT